MQFNFIVLYWFYYSLYNEMNWGNGEGKHFIQAPMCNNRIGFFVVSTVNQAV